MSDLETIPQTNSQQFYVVKEVRRDGYENELTTEKILLCTSVEEDALKKLEKCNELLTKYRSQKSIDEIGEFIIAQVDKIIPHPSDLWDRSDEEQKLYFKYRSNIKEDVIKNLPELELEIFKNCEIDDVMYFYIEIVTEKEPYSTDKSVTIPKIIPSLLNINLDNLGSKDSKTNDSKKINTESNSNKSRTISIISIIATIINIIVLIVYLRK